MSVRMEKTKTPGVYKRGSRYVVVYRAGGKQRKESARTLDEARRLKAARTADVARGEFHAASRDTFHDYAREWVERYQGRGRTGFRESTREDYRRLFNAYALRHFPERLRVSEMTPRHVAQYVGWLVEQKTPKGEPLSDSTVRNALNPVRACLRTAVAEGLLRSNPAQGVALPHRPRVEDEEAEEMRALTRAQLGTLLAIVHPRFRVFFTLLAATGVRFSEAIALQWRHVHLDGSRPHVKIRRALVEGRLHPPKTKYGRREVPVAAELVTELRAWRKASEWPRDEDLVFVSLTGTPLRMENVRRRYLRPAAEEAGVAWCGFHTFRHTCASLLFADGRNAKQVQRWLGHHSPAFTLATYVHLLDDDIGAALTIENLDPVAAVLADAGTIA